MSEEGSRWWYGGTTPKYKVTEFVFDIFFALGI